LIGCGAAIVAIMMVCRDCFDKNKERDETNEDTDSTRNSERALLADEGSAITAAAVFK